MAVDTRSLLQLTAKELAQLLRKHDISSKELVDSAYSAVEEFETKIYAFLHLTKDLAYKTAEEVDKKISNGEYLPPLAGIPIGIKDNILVKGYKNTCASKILGNFVAPYNATVIEKIKSNYIPIIGKTNLDEFAMGSSTENSAFQVTRNPWNLDKIPGGSSGGSAAAVSSGEIPFALGSDTGGSIRQPAGHCGIVGIKPTYGLVSRFGLVAFGSSLDQIGPLSRSVTDAAMLMQVIAGHDRYDSTSINTEIPDYTSALTGDIKGLRIGVVSELLGDGIDPEVKNSIQQAIKHFEELGATIDEASIPHTKYAISTYYIVAPAEASANLSRYDGVKYGMRNQDALDLLSMYKTTRDMGFGAEVKRRIMIGTYALSAGYYDAYYKKAQQVRHLIKDDYDHAFKQFDILLGPTSPTTAFDINSKVDDPLSMYLSDIGTLTANLAGIPAMSLPCGLDSSNLPIGLQLWAKPLNEVTLMNTAYTFEQKINLHLHPTL